MMEMRKKMKAKYKNDDHWVIMDWMYFDDGVLVVLTRHTHRYEQENAAVTSKRYTIFHYDREVESGLIEVHTRRLRSREKAKITRKRIAKSKST